MKKRALLFFSIAVIATLSWAWVHRWTFELTVVIGFITLAVGGIYFFIYYLIVRNRKQK